MSQESIRRAGGGRIRVGERSQGPDFPDEHE